MTTTWCACLATDDGSEPGDDLMMMAGDDVDGAEEVTRPEKKFGTFAELLEDYSRAKTREVEEVPSTPTKSPAVGLPKKKKRERIAREHKEPNDRTNDRGTS